MHHPWHKRDAWHRCLGDDEVPVAHDSATRLALAHAEQQAREFHDTGRLVNPLEAMAIACRDGHTTGTLYSIARDSALATGGNVEVILKHLEQAWPDFT